MSEMAANGRQGDLFALLSRIMVTHTISPTSHDRRVKSSQNGQGCIASVKRKTLYSSRVMNKMHGVMRACWAHSKSGLGEPAEAVSTEMAGEGLVVSPVVVDPVPDDAARTLAGRGGRR